MQKSFTPKPLQDYTNTSTKKEKTNDCLKPSPHVLKYLMAYAHAFEVIDCKNQQAVFLN